MSDMESGPLFSFPAPEGGRTFSWEIDEGATKTELVANVVFGARMMFVSDTAEVVPRSLAAVTERATDGNTVSVPAM